MRRAICGQRTSEGFTCSKNSSISSHPCSIDIIVTVPISQMRAERLSEGKEQTQCLRAVW